MKILILAIVAGFAGGFVIFGMYGPALTLSLWAIAYAVAVGMDLRDRQ